MIRQRSIETMTSFRRIVAIARRASIRIPLEKCLYPMQKRRRAENEKNIFKVGGGAGRHKGCPYLEISNVRFNPADNIGTHSFVKGINESEWFRFWSGGGLIRANCNEVR